MNLIEVLSVYRNKRILVTGDTGFKGSWLCQWLLELKADVFGYALEPPTNPSLFDQLRLREKINHRTGDVRHLDAFKAFLLEVKPDVVFHLAAQPLVRESYITPLDTMETNVMGTAVVLDAVRQTGISTTVVVITSDKSYENKEWLYGYRENDALGGYDPYSASKGAAEIVTSSWSRSFFHPDNYASHGVKVASARAGNVIGGGDWAKDRIVPDCIRSLQENEIIKVRNPLATRPWQHVLEPLGGYLVLASKLLLCSTTELENYSGAFNFGPVISSNKPVKQLTQEIIKCWGHGNWEYNKEDAKHEASKLNLTIDKAYHLLQWLPVWNFEETIKNTVLWYKEAFEFPNNVEAITNRQIHAFMDSFVFAEQ